MNKRYRRITALFLVFVLLLTGLPFEIKTYAAIGDLTLSVDYNNASQKYDISFPSAIKPGKVTLSYHDPEGKFEETEYVDVDVAYDVQKGMATASAKLMPDHIYDFSVNVFNNATDLTPSYQGKVYYLADMTFEGESFNVMANNDSAIEDTSPDPKYDGSGINIIGLKSGDDPTLKLRWKVPTIYLEIPGIISLIDANANALNLINKDISELCFQISMTVGQGGTEVFYNIDYDGGERVVEEYPSIKVSTDTDGFLSVTIQEDQGIEPGTEYALTNIGIIFENVKSEEIPLFETKLKTDSENEFMVKNMDHIIPIQYGNGYELSSLFTPMQIELTRVDTDKAEVRFKKITNGNYPDLFYQVQYAPSINKLFSPTNSWIKIPDSSLSASDAYGSEIVTIDISETNPKYYFRVVYYDRSSNTPRSSSLCLDLSLLSTDSGKPPLPREIEAEAVYVGRKKVKVPTTAQEVEIPASNLRVSFAKPLEWKEEVWETFRDSIYTNEDYTFHVILSTYLPESTIESQTKTIGSPITEIYLPVKQKRVLVFGKHNLEEDVDDPNRLIFTIPGDKLFFDYTKGTDGDNSPNGDSINYENNENPNEDLIKGDYPTFLVPNTTYYMQIFTSKLKENAEIDSEIWGDGLPTELSDLLSYTSPVISFTTWPFNEMPVPMPNIQLGIDPATNVDPITGDMTLSGISVTYDRVLTEMDWKRYTSVTTGRSIEYEIFLSRDPVTGFQSVATDSAKYPENPEVLKRHVLVTNSGILMADGSFEPILANTVYYLKARASLVVEEPANEKVIIGRSDYSAVKAITTPKIDSGGLDNANRDARSPSEFSIAVGADGELLLSDADVTLNWLHAEKDVTYEMVCTGTTIPPQAVATDYASDYKNSKFLDAYDEFRNPAGDDKLHFDVNSSSTDPKLKAIDLTVDANGRVLLPIRRRLLMPNQTYFFSLRAVRNRGIIVSGKSIETVSRWITIPVTTTMVKAPAFLEAVKDMEIGFNVQYTTNGAKSDSMEVYLKKAGTSDSQYIRLNRSQYTCVQDGTTFYFRFYNLEADQWYDIRLKDNTNNRWYDGESGSWITSAGKPYQAKTRDPLKEIEVRWEGEDIYNYFLEARTDNDVDYEKLNYNSSGFSDYGYDQKSESRIMFYREKTNLYEEEKSYKYIYYTRIIGKPVKDSRGVIQDLPLNSNTDYYIKLWARNVEDSIHIGPVRVRTDFSQDDYDNDQEEDSVIDLFNNEADELTQKLYWRVDIKEGSTVRAILKDDRIAGLLQAVKNSTVTVDLSEEQENTAFYEILIPYKTLEAIEIYDSRLNLKLLGAEITLNRGSIDLAALKNQALTNGAKEAMLLLRLDQKSSPKMVIPNGFTSASKINNLQAIAVGSRLAYSEINGMIYNILKKPDATGPFKYGILDRELSKVLINLDSYSYRSHTDLKDLVNGVMENVETELSRYLKDIVDGGSGLAPDFTVTKGITSFPGKIGVKLDYTYRSGFITPYANYGSGWKEPSGAKAYVMQVVIFRAEKPGEYAVVTSGPVIVQPGDPFNDALSKISSQYDLTKVFGKGTLYPANPIKGEQAVMLYAVLTHKDSEIAGLTPVQKTSKLGIGDVLGAKQLTGYMDNQSSLSLAVKLYCTKSNVDPAFMKPSRAILITDDSQINSRLYKYVVLGIDLNLAELENNSFDASGRTTIGKMLDMAAKALKKFE